MSHLVVARDVELNLPHEATGAIFKFQTQREGGLAA
jgi:hypothetical protein